MTIRANKKCKEESRGSGTTTTATLQRSVGDQHLNQLDTAYGVAEKIFLRETHTNEKWTNPPRPASTLGLPKLVGRVCCTERVRHCCSVKEEENSNVVHPGPSRAGSSSRDYTRPIQSIVRCLAAVLSMKGDAAGDPDIQARPAAKQKV